MSRRINGILLSLILLFSLLLVFDVDWKNVNASTLFSDDFADLIGWTTVNGVWSVSGGVLQGTTKASAEGLIWAGDTTWTNYQSTANLRTVNAIGDASIVVRYQGPGNFYWMGLGCWGHKFSISKVVNGSYTELAYSGLDTEVEVGKWYVVSGVAVNNMLQLFVDGTKVLETQDNSHSKGGIGFRKWNGTIQAQQLSIQSMGDNEIHEDFDTKIQTSDGGYLLAKIDSNNHIQLVRTDSSYTQLWSGVYGEGIMGKPGSQYVSIESLIQTKDGGFLAIYKIYTISSEHYSFRTLKINTKGTQQWDKSFDGQQTSQYSVLQTSDGGYAFLGISPNFGTELIKLDSAGNKLWIWTEFGNYPVYAKSIIQTGDSGYALAGYTNSYGAGGSDFWLTKLSSAGNQLWKRTYGGANDEVAYSIIQTQDGGYALAGYTKSFGAGGSDYWLVKTNSAGNALWNRTYGGANDEVAYSIIQTQDGGYTIAGSGSIVKVPADAPPITLHNYNGQWYTADLTVVLQATDDFTIVSETYYKINDGSIKTVRVNGNPVFSVEGANNRLEYWSVDSLGQEELHKTLNGIRIDKTPPKGSIVVNNGEVSTFSISVVLSLVYDDDVSGVSGIRLSNDGIWDTEGWEGALATKSWTLAPREGIKSIYYQIRDNAGLSSITYSDTITLVAAPSPTPTVSPMPTATPTPVPTATPSPTATPTPSASLTSSPTVSPTSTAIPTPTPAITPTPVQTPTPNPTPTTTLTPTPTTRPTQSPTQTPTSTPTATPTISPTPTQLANLTAHAGSDLIINEDTSVTFNGVIAPPNIEPENYIWSFVDVTNKKLNGTNPSYIFTSPGTYLITLNVKDATGNVATDTIVVRVLDITKPVANAGTDIETLVENPVSFDANLSSDNVGVDFWEWDFGDGINGTGQKISHKYAYEGVYTVKLMVKDQAGNMATDEVVISVFEVKSYSLWIIGGVIGFIVLATLILILPTRGQKAKSSQG